MRLVVLPLLLLTAACATGKPEIRTVYVDRVLPCPDHAERERLRALRPQALRTQPTPATAGERVAKMSAQLGRYEAEGGWADQVDAVLDRCQND